MAEAAFPAPTEDVLDTLEGAILGFAYEFGPNKGHDDVAMEWLQQVRKHLGLPPTDALEKLQKEME